MPAWPRLSSSTPPGRRAWTGVTPAGWLMEACGTRSQNHVLAVAGRPRACAVMESDIGSWASLTPFASPPPSKVSVSVSKKRPKQSVNSLKHRNRTRPDLMAGPRLNCLLIFLDNECFCVCFRKSLFPKIPNEGELHRGRPGVCQSWKPNRQSGPDLRCLEADGTRPLRCRMVGGWKCTLSNLKAADKLWPPGARGAQFWVPS